MPNPFRSEKEEFEFPAEIREAFAAYPKPATSANFNALFWAGLEGKRRHYRGFTGFLKRVWEVEIEGVAVWRLAASTLSGGLLCLVLMGLAVGSPNSNPSGAPLPAHAPQDNQTLTNYAFYRRDWDIDLLTPELQPPPRPQPKTKPVKPLKTGEFSCKDLNTSLV